MEKKKKENIQVSVYYELEESKDNVSDNSSLQESRK